MNSHEKKQIYDILQRYNQKDRVVPLSRIISEQQKTQSEKKYFSGFPRIDKATGGIKRGSLVVVSGQTGHGKTSVCTSITSNLLEKGVKSLWFSYEMSAIELGKKFKDRELPVIYAPHELDKKDLDFIEARIIEGLVKYNTEVIFIDHLHYLVDMSRLKNPSLEIGTIVRSLKRICVRHEVIIYLIAHTAKTRVDKRVDINDIRDSSFIGQESDIVLMVQRGWENGEYTEETTLYLEKNRYTGELGYLPIRMLKGKFHEMDRNHEH